MSHIGKYELEIENADYGVARKSLELLAEEFDFEIVEEYTSSWSNVLNETNANVGVIKDIASGFGIHIENGELNIVGDKYGNREQFEKMKKLFKSYYNGVLTRASFEQMGYNTQMKREEDKVKVMALER